MAGCRNCGFEGLDDARYCARCGTGLGDGGVELLPVGATLRSQDALALHQNSRRWPVVVLALAVVGWLLWPAVTAPASGGATAQTTATTGPTPRAPIEPRAAAVTTTSATTSATVTTTPSDGSGPAPGQTAATTPSPLSPRSTLMAEVVATTSTTTVIGPGGPLLGEPSGLSLLVGNMAGLRRVDLDTGVVTAYDVAGWPLIEAGSWLVLGNPNRSWLRAVPLADPETNAQLLGYTPAADVVARGAAPSQVWFLDLDVFDQRTGSAERLPAGTMVAWRLVDLDTGQSLDWAPVPGHDHPTDDPSVGSSSGGGLFTNVVGPAGGGIGPGVYDDEDRKVFDGRPLAVSEDHVLAQTCSRPTRCRLQWLDRTTWQVVDRPAPEGRTFWDGWLSPDGRILTYFRDDAGAEVFDVERGRVVDLGVAAPGYLAPSPDGRYLAAATATAFVVHDLTTGRTHPLDLGRPADHHLLFVATST